MHRARSRLEARCLLHIRPVSSASLPPCLMHFATSPHAPPTLINQPHTAAALPQASSTAPNSLTAYGTQLPWHMCACTLAACFTPLCACAQVSAQLCNRVHTPIARYSHPVHVCVCVHGHSCVLSDDEGCSRVWSLCVVCVCSRANERVCLGMPGGMHTWHML